MPGINCDCCSGSLAARFEIAVFSVDPGQATPGGGQPRIEPNRCAERSLRRIKQALLQLRHAADVLSLACARTCKRGVRARFQISRLVAAGSCKTGSGLIVSSGEAENVAEDLVSARHLWSQSDCAPAEFFGLAEKGRVVALAEGPGEVHQRQRIMRLDTQSRAASRRPQPVGPARRGRFPG